MITLKLRGEFEAFILSIDPSALPRNGYGGIMSWWYRLQVCPMVLKIIQGL